jgi:hypothetical protein
VKIAMILTGLKMTTTGLNSSDNKTASNCTFNKKSNHDGGNYCEADESRTSKCHPIKLICESNWTSPYYYKSIRIVSTGLHMHTQVKTVLNSRLLTTRYSLFTYKKHRLIISNISYLHRIHKSLEATERAIQSTLAL